ncbi:class I SAM-dependent methyltransferase [Xylanimonas sp. McL0601]|uniref:class I SAM-dependent methyltransferase n=1 Tax=Xylanimonas sp. McL0601 TaxID=3414739 RepID=UPI003CE82D52
MGVPVLPFHGWLKLREPADAAARSEELVAQVRASMAPGRLVVHDLGCGTGSMARWLAPRLAAPQHWVLYDRDDELLQLAAANPLGSSPGGDPITVETRWSEITRLKRDALAGADLVTASALLDVFTADELERFVTTCVEAGCPTLVALTVTGRVELWPSDPLDAPVTDAFNAHQQRRTDRGDLIGPAAVSAADAAFRKAGADVTMRPSPWRLGQADATLVTEWFTGWVGAAVEQRPELAVQAKPYAERRLAEIAAGRLSVTVHHKDLLARPR